MHSSNAASSTPIFPIVFRRAFYCLLYFDLEGSEKNALVATFLHLKSKPAVLLYGNEGTLCVIVATLPIIEVTGMMAFEAIAYKS